MRRSALFDDVSTSIALVKTIIPGIVVLYRLPRISGRQWQEKMSIRCLEQTPPELAADIVEKKLY